MHRRLSTLSLVLLLMAPLSGCGTMKAYDGESRPEEQLAFVIVAGRFDKTPFEYRDTTVQEIDGKPVDSSLVFEEIAVLPGPHTVTFHYAEWVETLLLPPLRTYAEDGAGSLSFEAKAGHMYEIRADRRDGRLWSWIVDIVKGHTVSGKRPPGADAERRAPVQRRGRPPA